MWVLTIKSMAQGEESPFTFPWLRPASPCLLCCVLPGPPGVGLYPSAAQAKAPAASTPLAASENFREMKTLGPFQTY